MRYPEYVYVPLGGLGDEWWGLYPETNSSCPHSVIAEMNNGSISIVPEGFFPTQNTSVNTMSGQVKCVLLLFTEFSTKIILDWPYIFSNSGIARTILTSEALILCRLKPDKVYIIFSITE